MARYTRKRYSGGGVCGSKQCAEEPSSKNIELLGSNGANGSNAVNAVNAANVAPNWNRSKPPKTKKVGTKRDPKAYTNSNAAKQRIKLQNEVIKLNEQIESKAKDGMAAIKKTKGAKSDAEEQRYHAKATGIFIQMKQMKAVVEKYEDMIKLLSSKSPQRGGSKKKGRGCFGGLCGAHKTNAVEPVAQANPVANKAPESIRQRERREKREAWLEKKMAGTKYANLPNNTRRALFIANWHQKVVRGNTNKNSNNNNNENTYAEMEREFGNA
jgi:hypothetical protein